jgi:hypothetical protein
MRSFFGGVQYLSICGARTRSGAPCQNARMLNGRCHMHGGKSLGGADSPCYKHGKYSKYNLERLIARALAQPPVDLSEILRSEDISALFANLEIPDLTALCDNVPLLETLEPDA